MMTDSDLTPVGEETKPPSSAGEAEAAHDATVAVETPLETSLSGTDDTTGEEVSSSSPETESTESTESTEPTEPTEPTDAVAETPAPAEPAVSAEAEAAVPASSEAEPPAVEELPVAETPAAEEPATEAAEPEAVAEPEPTSEPAAAPKSDEPKLSDEQLFEQAMSALEGGDDESGVDGGYKKLSKGDRVEATVIQVDRDRVFVDLGTKSEGIVPLGELSDSSVDDAAEHVKVGDKIQVVVLRPEGAEGNPIVSKKRADFEEAWDRIEQSFSEGKTLHAQVIDRVKGGLVVDIGVRGFVPATHVGSGKLRNIEKYVGQDIALKIIEIDRDRKKVVLSNRQAEEERRVSAKEHIFSNVSPGDILEGSVRRLVDYGAFVDLGGVDGLLHISEMSWTRIAHPKEMFKEGQKIKVMVLRLDPAAGKISLGHRQVLPDPWNLIRENYTVNQKLTCTIGRIVQTGAFIKLPEGAEAFLPLSEMSNRRLRRPDEAIAEGQEVEVQIIDLRPDDRRMVLSMRAAGSADRGVPMHSAPPSYDDDRDLRRGMGGPGKKKKGQKGGMRGRGRDEDDFEDLGGRRGFATGGATIGERLGMLKGFAIREDDEDVEDAEAIEEEAVAGEAGAAPVEAEATAAPAEERAGEPAPEPAPEAAPEAAEASEESSDER